MERSVEEEENGNRSGVEEHHVLEFLDSVDDYLTLIHSLSHLLRQGWFELACARHSMGVSRVNGALLDLKPRSASTSLRLVAPDDDASGEARFALNKWASSEEDKSSDASQLRRRRRVSEKTASQNEPPLVADDQVQKERLKSLSVFGTLVSPKLRTAQLSFETALEKIVEIANARSTALAAFHQVEDGLERRNMT